MRTWPRVFPQSLLITKSVGLCVKLTAGSVREWSESGDGSYIRHALFPRVVNGLCGYCCWVCGLGTCAQSGAAIVDAVHILPFAQFHNDDPRNGISLCKNHHWGFDRGWFGVDDRFKLIASPRVVSASKYIEQGSHVRLPAERQYAPALEALIWHRENVFLR